MPLASSRRHLRHIRRQHQRHRLAADRTGGCRIDTVRRADRDVRVGRASVALIEIHATFLHSRAIRPSDAFAITSGAQLCDRLLHPLQDSLAVLCHVTCTSSDLST